MSSADSAILDWLLEIFPLSEIFEEGPYGFESLDPAPDSHGLLPELQEEPMDSVTLDSIFEMFEGYQEPTEPTPAATTTASTMTSLTPMTALPAFSSASPSVVDTHVVPELFGNAYEMPAQTEALLEQWDFSGNELTPSPSEPMVCDEALSPESFVADVCKPKPIRRSPQRIPKTKKKPLKGPKGRKEHELKADNITHWLAKQLCNPAMEDVLAWKNRSMGTFAFKDHEQLALKWGEFKKNPSMNYNKFSRALRYHYERSRNKELIAIPNKLVYKFSANFMTNYVQKLRQSSS